jgi:hypothetical protein
MKPLFLPTLFCLLITHVFAQRQVILPFDSSGWASTRALDQNNQQVDPTLADPDFWQTWLDQSLGDYFSPLTYDGPALQTDQAAPFFAGNVPGIQGGTSLDAPADSTWTNGYFLKVIDGGELGYQNLDVKMLARDAAVIYLNGLPLTLTPNARPLSNGNLNVSEPGDGVSLLDLPRITFPPEKVILRPGPNLLAIAAARVSEEAEDFGFKLQITGEPGIVPISFVTQNIIGNRLHLRWATADRQKTIVKINNTQIIEGDSAVRNHHFTREFSPGSRIQYDILKPDLQSWEGDSTSGIISIPKAIIFSHVDSGWHYLQVRNAEGNDINPSLADTDFNQTWFQHTPPGFGAPPFKTINYDGPAFISASTPIQYGEAAGFPNFATELTPPAGGEGHTLWLLRSIDGGPNGFGELELDVRVRDDCFIYLNGELIGRTFFDTPASDTWIAHANSTPQPQPLTTTFSNAFGRPIFLNPGPNLLAVSVHSSESNLTSLGFSAELKVAQKTIPEIRDFQKNISANGFHISYLTGTPQPTIVSFGTNRTHPETHQISGDRIFHQFELADLKGSTTYFYEVLRGDGTPFPDPIIGHFTTPDSTFIEKSSSGWQVLHSLDNEGLGIDPALSDSDFNTTWMTLGMNDSLYDGPAFTPDQTTPIRVSGGWAGPAGTLLQNPGADRSGAVYLVRQINGPPSGIRNLDFDLSSARPYHLFLNGELIINSLGVTQSENAWNFYWENRIQQISRKPAFLLPGKNIIAISLHPFDQNNFQLVFDMALTGVPGSSDMIPLADPVITDSTTTIQWLTQAPTPSLIRYGPSRNDISNSITLPDSSKIHEIPLPNPPTGQRLYYEILKPDGSSYDPPSINSFITPKKSIIPLKSDWSYLNPRDPATDLSIDPATLDPDFYQTWSTQSIGTYQGNATYDGPAFSPPSPAPFGPNFTIATTIITQPAAVWFLKEVDGGPTGFHQLELNSNSDTSVTVFLNGNKIGETYTPIASQAIWGQSKGLYNRGSIIQLPSDLILPPGPNLIAVQMHISHNRDDDVFDLALTGTPLQDATTLPFALQTTTTTAELSWATSQAQSTRLRWGLSPSALLDSTEIAGNRTFHPLPLSNLAPATTYFLEVLDPSGNSHTPPTLASFRTKDHLILARQSSGWSVLENISEGTFADPLTNDPDFLTTWFNPASYDGPALTLNQSSPFVSQDRHLRPGETVLQTIDSKIRPIWLRKEIDGGETGYHSLTLDGILFGGIATYLNGQPLFSFSMPTNANLGAWNQAAFYDSNTSGNFSLNLPVNFTIPPGPNLLAIAIHPYDLEHNTSLTAEFELRGIPQKFSITQPTLGGLNFTNINLNWTTTAPAATRVRYGLDPLSLEQVSENSVLQTTHQITFPKFIEGGSYTFEILATDALGNPATSVGTFQILPQIMRLPFLQKASPSSMTIKWRTRDPGEALLRYGPDPNHLDQILTGANAPAPLTFFPSSLNGIITDHTVTITGLTPSTKYYYQIASDNSPAPARDLDQFFITPPLPGTPDKTRIWVVGDSGLPGQGVQDVKDAYLQYAGENPADLWLMLGDNAYNSGTDSEYQRGLFDIFPELLKNTPVWPTMGNHEGYSNQYYGVFELPTNGQSGGVSSGTEKYYSFDHGNIHFICLNSEEDPPGMIDWLKNDLQATRADWIIAFFHHGPYTKGSHNSDAESEHYTSRENYLPILEDFGVDLVLSGHSHQYERSHLLDGHYEISSSYRIEKHALDPGPGSPLGFTDRQTGLFQYTSEYAPYQKQLTTPHSGQISATIGSSSKLSSWSTSSGQDRNAITNPTPHPVHVSTIRALGSMIIDVEGHTLKASYLDSNGQIRDQFQIQKVLDESPAITWWQENFGDESYPYFADWFADADHDTNNNLTEYIQGGDPLQSDQLIEATGTIDGLDNGQPAQWFAIEYNLREGTNATVEYSRNLIDFYQSGVETRRIAAPDANGIARWESRVRRTNQRSLFFQIGVSR